MLTVAGVFVDLQSLEAKVWSKDSRKVVVELTFKTKSSVAAIKSALNNEDAASTIASYLFYADSSFDALEATLFVVSIAASHTASPTGAPGNQYLIMCDN